jgi:excisionase family DNA binding protein
MTPARRPAVSMLEQSLREFIAELVREEVQRAVAAAPHDEYLSTHAAAELAQVAEGTIRRWIRQGRLPDHRAGRLCRVRREDLERLLRSGRRRAGDTEATPEQLAARAYGSR